ncbi:MAG: hypothetical protein ACREQP_20785 [Candidatus Binatia bacterium]
MAVSEELEVLKELGRRLDKAGIAYMITGSTAGNFYAVPRMTRDIVARQRRPTLCRPL